MNHSRSHPRPGFGAPLQHNRFIVLLIGLFALLFVVAASELIAPRDDPSSRQILFVVFFVAMLVSAVHAVSATRRSFQVALLLVVPAAFFNVVGLVSDRVDVAILTHAFSAAMIGYTVAVIVRFLFVRQRVTSNLVCGSLCGYLLLGFLWASLFNLVETLAPNSLYMAVQPTAETLTAANQAESELGAIYFSFVTLCTLGYGDIVPVTGPARILAAMEAVVGQIFLTVLVARLVALHVAHQPTDFSVSNRD